MLSIVARRVAKPAVARTGESLVQLLIMTMMILSKERRYPKATMKTAIPVPTDDGRFFCFGIGILSFFLSCSDKGEDADESI